MPVHKKSLQKIEVSFFIFHCLKPLLVTYSFHLRGLFCYLLASFTVEVLNSGNIISYRMFDILLYVEWEPVFMHM